MNPRAVMLLFDDEPLFRDCASKVLEFRGFKVYLAHGPTEALQIFRGHIDEIDLVVTDLNMPDMSGSEMAWIMRQERPLLPLLLVSGGNDYLPDWTKATCGLLTKPFTPKQFIQAIDECLAGHPQLA
jgi:CheY-like chemotaxis protein